MNEFSPIDGFKGFVRMIVPFIIAAGGLAGMLVAGKLLQEDVIPTWAIHANAEVNFTLSLQLLLLPLSLVAILLVYACNREGFRTYFRFSFRASTAEAEGWKGTGPVVALIFTAGTAMFMSGSVSAQGGQVNAEFFKLLPLVLLLATTNAWTEEIITRFVFVAGLHKVLPPFVVCLVSAMVFGLAHISGTPSGMVGIATAGILGWFLAKSVIETRSMAWAWFIHFLQDVMIFGGGAMVIAGSG